MEEILITKTTREALVNEISQKLIGEISDLLERREKSKIYQKQYFTITESADLLRVSRTTIFDYLKKGVLIRKKVGKKTLIPRESIQSTIKEIEGKLHHD